MRISDWSSDVCSSDLRRPLAMWRREVAGEKSHRMLQRAVMPQTRATHIHPRAAALAGACVQIEIKARQHVAIGVQYIVIAYVRVPSRNPFAYPKAQAEHLRSEEHTSELQSLMRTSY